MTAEQREQLERDYTAAQVADIDTLRDALAEFENEIEEILKDCPDPGIIERQRGQALYRGRAVYLDAIRRIASEEPDWDKAEEEALADLAKDPQYVQTREEIRQLKMIASIFEHPEK